MSKESDEEEVSGLKNAPLTVMNIEESERQPLRRDYSFSSLESSNADVCRICHCEADSENILISPCTCSGSLKYVHQACLQQWIKSANMKCCELCKRHYTMTATIKPFCKWQKLEMTKVERRKIFCSVIFHLIAITCVVWSLYVLIERTMEEVKSSRLEWPFWTKLIVVGIGFTGGFVFMYIQCKMYTQLFTRWRAYNRVIYVQNCPKPSDSVHSSRHLVVEFDADDKILTAAATASGGGGGGGGFGGGDVGGDNGGGDNDGGGDKGDGGKDLDHDKSVGKVDLDNNSIKSEANICDNNFCDDSKFDNNNNINVNNIDIQLNNITNNNNNKDNNKTENTNNNNNIHNKENNKNENKNDNGNNFKAKSNEKTLSNDNNKNKNYIVNTTDFPEKSQSQNILPSIKMDIENNNDNNVNDNNVNNNVNNDNDDNNANNNNNYNNNYDNNNNRVNNNNNNRVNNNNNNHNNDNNNNVNVSNNKNDKTNNDDQIN